MPYESTQAAPIGALDTDTELPGDWPGEPPDAPEEDDQAWWERLFQASPDIARSAVDIFEQLRQDDPDLSPEEARELAERQAQMEAQERGTFTRYLPWVAVGGFGLLALLALRR